MNGGNERNKKSGLVAPNEYKVEGGNSFPKIYLPADILLVLSMYSLGGGIQL